MRTINSLLAIVAAILLVGIVSNALDSARVCAPVDALSRSSVVCNDPKTEVFVKPTETVTGVTLRIWDQKTGREVSKDIGGLKLSFADVSGLNWKNAKAVTKVIASFEKTWKVKPAVAVSEVEFDKAAKLYADPKTTTVTSWQNTKVERTVASERDKMLSISGVGRAQKK